MTFAVNAYVFIGKEGKDRREGRNSLLPSFSSFLFFDNCQICVIKTNFTMYLLNYIALDRLNFNFYIFQIFDSLIYFILVAVNF